MEWSERLLNQTSSRVFNIALALNFNLTLKKITNYIKLNYEDFFMYLEKDVKKISGVEVYGSNGGRCTTYDEFNKLMFSYLPAIYCNLIAHSIHYQNEIPPKEFLPYAKEQIEYEITKRQKFIVEKIITSFINGFINNAKAISNLERLLNFDNINTSLDYCGLFPILMNLSSIYIKEFDDNDNKSTEEKKSISEEDIYYAFKNKKNRMHFSFLEYDMDAPNLNYNILKPLYTNGDKLGITTKGKRLNEILQGEVRGLNDFIVYSKEFECYLIFCINYKD